MRSLKDKKKYLKFYYIKNKERILQRAKVYGVLNKDKSKERSRKYYLLNKEKIRKQNRKWYIKNKKKVAIEGREKRLKKIYGLSKKDYDTLLIKQNHKCYLCELKETSKFRKKIKALAIDHCHKTGKIRGLACSRCNRSVLGAVLDDPILLLKIACNFYNKQVDFNPDIVRFN